MSEQKIKQDNAISIGKNIRMLRLQKGLGQTELVRRLELAGQPMTRESLVKDRGRQAACICLAAAGPAGCAGYQL